VLSISIAHAKAQPGALLLVDKIASGRPALASPIRRLVCEGSDTRHRSELIPTLRWPLSPRSCIDQATHTKVTSAEDEPLLYQLDAVLQTLVCL